MTALIVSLIAGLSFSQPLRCCIPQPCRIIVHAQSTTLDQYEGQTGTEFSEDYLNPDKGPSDDKDMKYEHPADLERPQFHPMAKRGFISDPCGPLYDPKHERHAFID